MNRDGFTLWRIIHPTTIVFFALILPYALGVENGILAPVEILIRGLPMRRWLVTLLFYVALLIGVGVFYRLLTNTGRFRWLDVMSSNRGGLGLFDAFLLLNVVGVIFLGWRYFGIFDPDLLPIAIITVLTALVGLFRSPPWQHIIIFQTDSKGDQMPPLAYLQMHFGRGEQATWIHALERLVDENPGFREESQTPGQELYAPADVRPIETTPDPAVGAATPPPPPP